MNRDDDGARIEAPGTDQRPADDAPQDIDDPELLAKLESIHRRKTGALITRSQCRTRGDPDGGSGERGHARCSVTHYG